MRTKDGKALKLPFTIPPGVQVAKYSGGSDAGCERDDCGGDGEGSNEAVAIVSYRADSSGDFEVCDSGCFCYGCLSELTDFLSEYIGEYGAGNIRLELYRRVGSMVGSYVTLWDIKEKKP